MSGLPRRAAFCLVAFGVLAQAGSAGVSVVSLMAANPARIVFVDIDQGDGVVMKIGGKVIVSDAGEFRIDAVNEELERLEAKRIDVAILSHPHDDHVKNFVALFARWEVKKAVLSRSEWWEGTKTGGDGGDHGGGPDADLRARGADVRVGRGELEDPQPARG